MSKKHFPESELIINADGSCFHLHLKPEQLADKIILVGDPARVDTVAAHFDSKECEVSSREFHTPVRVMVSVATTLISSSTSSTPWPISTITPVRSATSIAH